MNETIYNAEIRFQRRTPRPSSVYVGLTGEHNVQTVRFEGLPDIADAIWTMSIILPDGTGGDALTITDGKVTITRTYTQKAGQWTAWVTAQVGTELVWKSEPFRLIVGTLPDVEEAIEIKYPSALEECLAKADEAIASAGISAENARQAGASAAAAAGYETGAANQALVSEGYATGRQNGTPAESGPYYQNNAMYYSGLSADAAGEAGRSAEAAAGSAEAAAASAASITGNTASVADVETYLGL